MGNNVVKPANLARSGLVSLGPLLAVAAVMKKNGATNEEIARQVVPAFEELEKRDGCGAFGEAAGFMAGLAGGVAGGMVSGPAAFVAVPVASTAADLAVTPVATYLCHKAKSVFSP